jgi:hypothetical protein
MCPTRSAPNRRRETLMPNNNRQKPKTLGRTQPEAVWGADRMTKDRRGRDEGPIDSASAKEQLVTVEGSSKRFSEGMKREHGVCLDGAEAVAAPATLSGELAAKRDHWATGKVGQRAVTREPGDLPSTVPGLMGERGCSSIVGIFHRNAPKALTRFLSPSASA